MSSSEDDDWFPGPADLSGLLRAADARAFNQLRMKCVEVGLVDSSTPVIDILHLVIDLAFHGVSLEDVIRARHAVNTHIDAEKEQLKKLAHVPVSFRIPATVVEYHGNATLHFSCTDGRTHEVQVPSGSRVLVYVH